MGAIALIQSGGELAPHAYIKGKATRPVEEQGKSFFQVEHHQFQHLDVQASRENVLVAAVAIGPARARVPKRGKEPQDHQPPISSKKPITPALHGQHRQQQGDQGDADART